MTASCVLACRQSHLSGSGNDSAVSDDDRRMQGRQDAYEGEWWLPSDEANKIGGILDLGDTHQLRLLGSFDKQEPPPLEPTFDPSILLGRSIGKAVTLLNGRFGPMTFSLFDGGSTIGIRVPVAFVGTTGLRRQKKRSSTKSKPN